MIELASDDFHLAGVVVEVTLLAGDLQMAGAGEIAGDVFFFHNALDAGDGVERGRVHTAREVASVLCDELIHAQLQPREDHAAVARTGAPTDGFGFEYNYFRAAFGERQSGREASEAGADDSYIRDRGQGIRRRHGHRCCG